MKQYIIYFIAIFLCFATGLEAQQKPGLLKPEDNYVIVPVQAGTVTINGKNLNVSLNDRMKSMVGDNVNYYVVFTPVDGGATPSVSAKKNTSFNIVANNTEGKTAKSSTYDYIVFIKQQRGISDNKQLKPATRKN